MSKKIVVTLQCGLALAILFVHLYNIRAFAQAEPDLGMSAEHFQQCASWDYEVDRLMAKLDTANEWEAELNAIGDRKDEIHDEVKELEHWALVQANIEDLEGLMETNQRWEALERELRVMNNRVNAMAVLIIDHTKNLEVMLDKGIEIENNLMEQCDQSWDLKLVGTQCETRTELNEAWCGRFDNI